MVESEQMQDGGMEVVHMDFVFGDLKPDVIGGAVDMAAFDAAACHPDGEPVVVMIPADLWGEWHLGGGSASEFASPKYEGIVQHSPVLEILQQCGDWLVALGRQPAVGFLDVFMGIPWLAAAMPDLYVTDSAFRETSCHEDLPALHGISVHFPDILRFLADIECVGGLGLHAEGELQRLDSGLELGVTGVLFAVQLVELLDVAELFFLLAGQNRLIAKVGNEPVCLSFFCVDVGSLIDAGQESAAPVGTLRNWEAAGTHDDKSWEALVFGAKPVKRPRTDAGSWQGETAGVHHHECRLVIGHIVEHGAYDAEFVCVLCHMGKEFADLYPALAVFGELEVRAERGTAEPLVFAQICGHREGFAVEFFQLRFRIKRVHLGGTAIHEQMNDAFCFSGKLRTSRSQRGQGSRDGLCQAQFVEKPAER